MNINLIWLLCMLPICLHAGEHSSKVVRENFGDEDGDLEVVVEGGAPQELNANFSPMVPVMLGNKSPFDGTTAHAQALTAYLKDVCPELVEDADEIIKGHLKSLKSNNKHDYNNVRTLLAQHHHITNLSSNRTTRGIAPAAGASSSSSTVGNQLLATTLQTLNQGLPQSSVPATAASSASHDLEKQLLTIAIQALNNGLQQKGATIQDQQATLTANTTTIQNQQSTNSLTWKGLAFSVAGNALMIIATAVSNTLLGTNC